MTGAGLYVIRNDFPRIGAEMEAKAKAVEENVARGVLDKAERRVPVATGTLRDSGHLDGNEVVFDAQNQDGMAYGAFVEYGEGSRPAQPFLRPAIEEERPEFEAELIKVLR